MFVVLCVMDSTAGFSGRLVPGDLPSVGVGTAEALSDYVAVLCAKCAHVSLSFRGMKSKALSE